MVQSKPTVLVVDDDADVRESLVALLGQDGMQARSVGSAREALTLLDASRVDVMITDLRMPGMDGMALLERSKRDWPDLPVLMLTAHGSTETGEEATRKGAAGFLFKTCGREQLLYETRKALSVGHAREQRPTLRDDATLVGDSEPMRQVWRRIERAARSDAHVLVRGESGTGKELVVESIHQRSRRAEGPLVKVNCAALPDSLIEDELFGHEKGAFTGAVTLRKGRVELAEGGTLFLDEIGDISPAVQVRLLRLLENRTFERVGGARSIGADVRFVAATHRDLEAMVREGTFREDLFFRLDVIPIELPPLRERGADSAILADHFLAELGAVHDRRCRLSAEAREQLMAHTWPGNVRELRNTIERLVVLADAEEISDAEVEQELRRRLAGDGAEAAGDDPLGSLEDARSKAERSYLEQVLAATKGNRTLAARLSGLSRRAFYYLLERHGIG